MSKKILSGSEVLQKLLSGVNRIVDPVKATLGPNGRNVVFERLSTNQPISTRDGVTVADQIDADDPFENIAVEMIKGVAREAVDQSGDGTTTATLLAQAIFQEGVKATQVGSNPVAIKRGIEKATKAVVEQLKKMAVKVTGEQLRQVATISANNDEFLGSLIAEAMSKAGEDGVVTVEISRSNQSSLELVDGMQFASGWLSPSFVTNPERNEAVLEDVCVLLHEKKLTSIKPMLPLIQSLAQEGKSLLVVAEDVTDEALAILSVNTERKLLRAVAVKTPGGPDHLHDIAALTRAKVITETSGIKLNGITVDMLGHARKVITKPTTTTVYGDGNNPALEKKLRELRTLVTETPDGSDKLRLQARLARLAGGIAVIKVGGVTEVEALERKDRLEDAMHATRCAKAEGVLPGGGLALFRTSNVDTTDWSEDEIIGAQIVQKATIAPIRTLAQNSGESPEYVTKRIAEGSGNFGWNARHNAYGDLVDAGVLDPLRVVRVALESAASVASIMLITQTLVANDRE